MKNNKKKMMIIIAAVLIFGFCAIIFIYSHGNNAYVKVKIHPSKECQKTMGIDFRHAYMTGTKTMNKFYSTKQKQLVLNEENAGYGTCEAKIPLIDDNKKSEYEKTSIQKQFLLKDHGNYRINLGG